MKDQIRKEKLQLRKELSLEDKMDKCNAIVENVLPLLEDVKTLGIYIPYGNEVDVTSLLFVYKQVGAPKVLNDKDMDFFLIEDLNHMEKAYYGVLEPVSNVWMAPTDFDAIIVPLVAFDENKNRVGHGKGYYDRYLAKTNAKKIGVAYAFQQCEPIETNPFDVPLDYIVTEEKIYE